MSNWKNPKIIVGNVAKGDFYFPRLDIEAQIWEELNKGSHILLAAPRRVGKTSVMLSMLENSPADIRCVFKNIQGVQSEEQFYQQFFESILECLNKFQQGMGWFKDLFKRLNIQEINLEGVKFGDKKPLVYHEEIHRLLVKLSENEFKIVLFLDELPEVLNNLYKKQQLQEAKSILNNLRMWRQNPLFHGYFHLVLAGSVGVHHIVKIIEGRTADINDLSVIDFEALTKEEAREYLHWATDEATVQYNDALAEHLLSKIHYFIPYFINLLLDEINKAARKSKNPNISRADIDAAFDKVVKNSAHFEEWKNRIFDYYPKLEADLLNEVLTFIAHYGKISKQELYNLAVKHQMQNNYMTLVRDLENDGYLVEQGEHHIYISPFLQAFWKQDNPVYHGK